MAALHQHPLRPEVVQGTRGVVLGLRIDDVDADQQSHLVEIGGDQVRQRKQHGAQGVQRAGVQQGVTVHGGADRVDDEWSGAGQAKVAP